jgi:hypothetical protein
VTSSPDFFIHWLHTENFGQDLLNSTYIGTKGLLYGASICISIRVNFLSAYMHLVTMDTNHDDFPSASFRIFLNNLPQLQISARIVFYYKLLNS